MSNTKAKDTKPTAELKRLGYWGLCGNGYYRVSSILESRDVAGATETKQILASLGASV